MWRRVARTYDIPMYRCRYSTKAEYYPEVRLMKDLAKEEFPFPVNSFSLIFSQYALDTGKLAGEQSHVWVAKMLRVLEPGPIVNDTDAPAPQD